MNWLWKLVRTPTPLDIAVRQLEETKVRRLKSSALSEEYALLAAQASEDVDTCNQRIERLEIEIKQLD